MKITGAISLIVQGENISESHMYDVMNEIMGGEATPAQIGSLITGLRIKGETVEEITGAVRVMREKVTFIDTGIDMDAGGVVVDTCGTGGDGSGTFNVSTTCAFVVAGGGVTVAKHGNRSVSSKCGSADVLEAAGVKLDISSESVSKCIKELGIGFLFAPMLHGAMKHAIGPRREIGIRTIFNILGPLTNPAGANVQVLGVFSPDLTEPLAKVLQNLGSRRAMVVHGEGNLDEFTLTGSTKVSELKDGEVITYHITPEEVGFERCDVSALRGGETPEQSVEEIRRILGGEKGPKRDMVLLNSAAAFVASSVAADFKSGVALAADIIDGGAALKKLEKLIKLSNSLK